MPTPGIKWDDKLIVELAASCKTKKELGYEYAKATGQRFQSNTLISYLHRNRDLNEKVVDAIKTYAGTPTPPSDWRKEVSREEILESENRELRKALGKGRKEDVHQERVTRAVEEALATVPPPRRRPPKPKPKLAKDAHHVQLLQLSDFHGGEVVDPDVVNGLNSYDWETMERRVDELLDAVLSHKRNSPALSKLAVTFGGDMCSGSNHEELAITNEYPLAEQAIRMGALQGQIVEQLAPHYNEINVYVVEGNHPRLSKKPAAKNPSDNGDWIAGVFMAQYLKAHTNVKVQIGKGSLRFTLAGLNFYLAHFDGVRSSMPGVPWGGLMRRINQLQSQYTDRVDHWLAHHFHTACVVQGGRLLLNGSLKGVDEYTLKCFGGGDPPTQLLSTFDEKRRRITDVRYITPTAGL